MKDEEMKLNNFIYEGSLNMVRRILANGVNLNNKGEDDCYPIIIAINSMNIEILQLIIEEGADVNIDEGLPLYVAIDACIDSMFQENKKLPSKLNVEVLNKLIELGADPSKNKLGEYNLEELIKEYEISIISHNLFFQKIFPYKFYK